MQNDQARALGTEKIGRLMLKFSLPCVFSLLVGALYNIVDQIFIGNSRLSTLGNAAAGVVFPMFIIAQAFAWWFGDGCAAFLNICQGKNDMENAHRAMGSGITLTLISSLVLMAVFYPLKRPVLTLFGASENTMGMAVEYFDIILAFFPAYMLSNMLNGVIRADGSPAWAMNSMLVGAIVNIALDPLFIFTFDMGMTGAAAATVIGQTLSFIFSAAYFFKSKTFRLMLKSFIPDFRAAAGAIRLGASSFITQATIVIISVLGNAMLAKYGAASEYGADIPIAVIGIENKVFTVVINLVVGIVLGCQPVIGYNVGAGNRERVKALYRNILLCTVVISAAATLVFELAPRAVVSLFGTPENIPNPEDYWTFAEKTFRIYLSLLVFTCFIKMSSIFFQAAGMPVRAVIASMVRDIICFVPLTVILPLYMGIDGILWAAPASDAVSVIVALGLTVSFFSAFLKNTSPAEQTKIKTDTDNTDNKNGCSDNN